MSKWAIVIGVGTNPYAVASCLYAFKREVGDAARVYFLHTSATEEVARAVAKAAKHLFPGADAKFVEVPDADLEVIVGKAREVIREARGEGLRIAVDVTPGKKTMVIALYRAGVEEGVDEVLYLNLICREYESVLYPLIPKHCIKLERLGGHRARPLR